MSAIIDDKVVAGANNSNTIKEDPIVALTVYKIYFFDSLFNLIQYTTVIIYLSIIIDFRKK